MRIYDRAAAARNTGSILIKSPPTYVRPHPHPSLEKPTIAHPLRCRTQTFASQNKKFVLGTKFNSLPRNNFGERQKNASGQNSKIPERQRVLQGRCQTSVAKPLRPFRDTAITLEPASREGAVLF